MKTTQVKYAKPSISTPTSKQSYSELLGSQHNLKQSSRYNPKLISAKPDSNLNSPSPLLQKIGFTIQTPCRSSSKLLYIKQKYSNITQNPQKQEISPKPTKNYTERPYYDKYSEINSLQSSVTKPSKLSSRLMNSELNKRESSLSPSELIEHVESGKCSINIFGSFQKGSPTSSSQAKLTYMNRRDSNTIQDSIQPRAKKIASPKVNSKHFLCDSSDNKENINTINLDRKSDHKNTNTKKLLLNGSPEDLRIQHSTTESYSERENGGNTCTNHPHKKAKYTTAVPDTSKRTLYQRRENLLYCSKCAIKMVASGQKLQELVTSSIDKRKSEVEEFLEKLFSAREKSDQLIESVRRKKEDVSVFYSKQAEKAELIVSAILKIVNEEKMHALEELTLSQEQTLEEIDDIQKHLEDRLNSITSIQSDIEKNLHNILRKIDADPFKTIMNKYNERLDYFLSFLDDHVKNHQVSVSKLPGFKRETLENLRPNLLSFFDKVIVTTALVKKDPSPEKSDVSELSYKPSPQTGRSKDNLYKNSLYVSFENKEIFENAIDFSQQSSLQETKAEITKRCSDLYSYTYGQKAPQIRTDPDTSPKAFDSSKGGYLSGREESKGFIKKADIDLECFMTDRTVKTPQSSRSQNILISNTTQTKRSLASQEYSEEKVVTHRPNTEFDEAHVSLLQQSFEDIPTLRYSRFGTEGSMQPHNRHESCSSSDILISSQQKSTVRPEIDKNLSPQSNPSTMKYITILEKITTSQSRKNAEYSDLIKVSPKLSHHYSRTEDRSANEFETVGIMTERSLDDIGQPSERMAPDGSILARQDGTFENKELKNYPPFFHFLENKINNEKPNQFAVANYQKSLFCCSPNFKENIEPSNGQ